jgi:uncharacterized membrane protein YgcG
VRRGAEETLARVDDEVLRQAGAAVARALLEEEAGRAAAAAAEADRVAKAYFRAPLRATECQAEEAAVLACEPGGGGGGGDSGRGGSGGSGGSGSGGGGGGGGGGGATGVRDSCTAAFSEYERCAERVVARIMRPAAAAPALK